MTDRYMWDRSRVIGLAKPLCSFCHGYGMAPVHRQPDAPCRCALRAIFRICYARYRECEALAVHTNGITWDRCGGPAGYRCYSRKRQEYAADFCLVSQRTLPEPDYEVFRLHYLLGSNWRVCCRRLRMDRGTFFHRVYAIEERLGRTFAELKPYPLYPVDEYFAGAVQAPPPVAAPEREIDTEPVRGVFQWGARRLTAVA